jgi:hypothetical protein
MATMADSMLAEAGGPMTRETTYFVQAFNAGSQSIGYRLLSAACKRKTSCLLLRYWRR